MNEPGGPVAVMSHSPERTIELGRRAGALLRGGETVSLIGELGSGKTRFAQGVAQGLGVKDIVVSPTFLIHRTYHGRIALHHFDFYRLTSEMDLESVGFFDFQAENPPSVVVVEWADKFPEALDEPILQVRFHLGPQETDRSVQFSPCGLAPGLWEALAGEVQTP